jgi:hypothetical protein
VEILASFRPWLLWGTVACVTVAGMNVTLGTKALASIREMTEKERLNYEKLSRISEDIGCGKATHQDWCDELDRQLPDFTARRVQS